MFLPRVPDSVKCLTLFDFVTATVQLFFSFARFERVVAATAQFPFALACACRQQPTLRVPNKAVINRPECLNLFYFEPRIQHPSRSAYSDLFRCHRRSIVLLSTTHRHIHSHAAKVRFDVKFCLGVKSTY
jgi:hypothetical protein